MTIKKDLASIRHYFKGFSVGFPRDRELWATLKRITDEVATLEARSEYLTVCPECNAAPTMTGFPKMDEDGCCAACGVDLSIAGLVDTRKESEAALTNSKAVLESVKDRMDEFAYQELASALNP